MNVLVIDDDPAAQQIAKVFLENSGYQPVLHVDGQKGLKAALAPDGPPIILLDWMMPRMDGTAVCKALRAARPRVRPYIILLSAKHDKDEIAAGLDAGADDFVSKPFNAAELQARLRVARRTIEHQLEILKQIEDNESLSQRNNLLTELMSKRQNGDTSAAGVANEKAPKPAEPKPTEFSEHDVRYMLSISLLELRIALEALSLSTKLSPVLTHDYCGWGGVLLPEQHLWVDLVVTVKPGAAEHLFARSLGRKHEEEAELAGFVAELARMVTIGFTRMLRVRAGEALQPLLSRGQRQQSFLPLNRLPVESKSYNLVVEGQELRLMLGVEPCPRTEVTPDSLRPLDMLAGPYPTQTLGDAPLFKEGAVMTMSCIEKLASHVASTSTSEIPVIRRPSELSRYFNLGV